VHARLIDETFAEVKGIEPHPVAHVVMALRSAGEKISHVHIQPDDTTTVAVE